MNLADKPCYPNGYEPDLVGITFRERLIIALASNVGLIESTVGKDDYMTPITELNAKDIINQADAIIKELMKGYE